MYFLTDPDTISKKCAEGMACSYPELVQVVPESYNGRSLLRMPVASDRVNIVVCGGGGGDPFAHSLVMSPDLADIAVNGGLGAAPSAYDFYEAAKYINSSKGYMLIFNNFMGDYLNADMGSELLRIDGLKAAICPFNDDCLSTKENENRTDRTGLIGLVLAVKAASAYAKTGASLEEVERLVKHMNERTSSVFITMDFENKVLNFGEGISGEPAPIVIKDDFTIEACAKKAYEILINDLKPQQNEKLYVVINRTLSAKPEDAFALSKAISDYSNKRIPFTQMSTGLFMFMSEAYGISVSILCADEQVEKYLQKRCYTDSFIL